MKIRIGDVRFTEEHRKVVDDIMKSERITEGKYTRLFEEEVEKYLGVKHCVAVTNGTVALQLVSQYLGVEKVVCSPALTFPATANAFLITGQAVGLCDVDESLLIDLESMTDEDKKRIDILVPVHLMGYCANMPLIMEQAKKYGWKVVEDTAEAFGAEFNGQKAGTFGDFGTFSFYVSHNIWGGELGCVVTNDDEAAKALRSMKNHGRDGDPMQFLHTSIGSNYKTNEFCAGFAYVNLKNVKEILLKRRSISVQFEVEIDNDHLTPYAADTGFSPLGYPILADSEEYRNHICKVLNDNGIETRSMFPNLANQKAYKGLWKATNYPIATKLEKQAFYIGSHQYMSDADIKKIIRVINNDK